MQSRAEQALNLAAYPQADVDGATGSNLPPEDRQGRGRSPPAPAFPRHFPGISPAFPRHFFHTPKKWVFRRAPRGGAGAPAFCPAFCPAFARHLPGIFRALCKNHRNGVDRKPRHFPGIFRGTGGGEGAGTRRGDQARGPGAGQGGGEGAGGEGHRRGGRGAGGAARATVHQEAIK